MTTSPVSPAVRFPYGGSDIDKRVASNFLTNRRYLETLFGQTGSISASITAIELAIEGIASEITTIEAEIAAIDTAITPPLPGSLLSVTTNPSTNGSFTATYNTTLGGIQEVTDAGQTIEATFTPRGTKVFLSTSVYIDDPGGDAYLCWLSSPSTLAGNVPQMLSVPSTGLTAMVPFTQLVTGLTPGTPTTLSLGMLSDNLSAFTIAWSAGAFTTVGFSPCFVAAWDAGS